MTSCGAIYNVLRSVLDHSYTGSLLDGQEIFSDLYISDEEILHLNMLYNNTTISTYGATDTSILSIITILSLLEATNLIEMPP